jgi:putative nucleotidyltransferase with HDIG domain
LALAFSMRRMMTGNAASRLLYNSYSRHALATALLTQAASSKTHSCEMETAFAAGLFHDVGKLLVYTAAPEAVPTIVDLWESGEGSYEDAELDVIESTHSELSAIVLEGWKLPDEICNAARYHHALEDCPGEADSEAPSLARLVQAADLLVNLEGYRTPESKRAIEADPAQAFERLGLEGDAQAAMSRFRDEIENLHEIFH